MREPLVVADTRSAMGRNAHFGEASGSRWLRKRKFETLPEIIHGRKQECSPSAARSLYLGAPIVLSRISSLGPCEPAIGPQGGTNSRTAETVGSVKRSPSGSSSWGGSGCIGVPPNMPICPWRSRREMTLPLYVTAMDVRDPRRIRLCLTHASNRKVFVIQRLRTSVA